MSAPLKLMAFAFLAMLVLPLASSEDATGLDKYLDCLTDRKVDIVFVFDTTGSMEGEINELSAIARNFASDLEASRIDHRLGLVEFRDFPKTCDGGDEATCGSPGDFPYKIKGNGNLTGNISTLNSWLRELKAGGGGGPEAVLAALRHTVSNCQWRSDADKVIIVLTDAGPHPDGDCCNAEGDTLDGTIFGLTSQGTRVHVIGPEDAALRRIAGETGGQFFKIRSGLSLKPLLKEITGAMSCSFKVEAETACVNRTLEAKVRLVGKDTIPFVAGQTESWMYLDQAGSKSRYNLSYDQAAGAYLARVPDTCGPMELTVYGRVGERSAVQSVQVVDCGSCEATAEEAQKVMNLPPEIISLAAEPEKPYEVEVAITWTVEAKDPNGDQALYRFFLDDEPMTDWQIQNHWTWTAKEAGSYRIEAQVRDGKHAGANGLDDRRSASFEINKPASVIKANAESWNKTLVRSGNESGYSVQQKSDGGYVLAGTKDSGVDNAWMIKTDASGNKLWDKFFNELHIGRYNPVQQTSDSGYIIVGRRNPFSFPQLDFFQLIKTDANGNMIWNKTFGDGSFTSKQGGSIQQTDDGGYIIAGIKKANITSETKGALLIKADANGNMVWDTILEEYYVDVLTDSVQQTSDGGYIIASIAIERWDYNYEKGALGGNYGDTYILLIKTDANGNKLWVRAFNGVAHDSHVSVQQTIDGGYIIAGGNLLIKTDSNGNQLWDRAFERTYICSIQQTSDGGYITTGGTTDITSGDSDVLLIKTDANGNKLWDKTFGGSDYDSGASVQQTIDGGYIAAGTTNSYGSGYSDIWLIKTDDNGDKLWDRTFG
jgi:hypothetical protein